MHPPETIGEAFERLRSRLATLRPEDTTVGALLDAGRDIHGEVSLEGSDGDEAHLSFETFGTTNAHVNVELVWHWPHSDTLDGRPERLLLRFEAVAGPHTREVSVRSRDYPHTAAFVTAALEAAELESNAPASNPKVEIEHA